MVVAPPWRRVTVLEASSVLPVCGLLYSHGTSVRKVLLLAHFTHDRKLREVQLLPWGHTISGRTRTHQSLSSNLLLILCIMMLIALL